MKIYRTSHAGGTIALALVGRLRFDERKIFCQAIRCAREEGPKSIILNMEKVSYIDSAGLALLKLAQEELRDAGISLYLHQPQGRVLKILELARIQEVISILNSIPGDATTQCPPVVSCLVSSQAGNGKVGE